MAGRVSAHLPPASRQRMSRLPIADFPRRVTDRRLMRYTLAATFVSNSSFTAIGWTTVLISLIGGQYESESAEACQRGGQDQRPELAMIGLRRLSDQPPEHRHDGLLEPVLRTVIDWVTLGQVVNPDRWFVAYSLRQRRVGKGALCAVPGRTRWLCPPAPIASARSDDIGASLRVLWNHQKPSDDTPKLAAYCVRCGAESVAGPARGGGVAVDGRA